jgi:hypothetical protein
MPAARGHDRLQEHLDKGDKAVASILRPPKVRKGQPPRLDATGWDEKQADEDGLKATRTRSLADDDGAPPTISLEDYLLQVAAESLHPLPGHGPLKGDMASFIQTMKAATVDIVASPSCPQGVTPCDVFALHLYTRAELFGQINRAYRDNDATEMARWRVVVWHMCAAARRLPSSPGVFIRGVGKLFNFVPIAQYKPGAVVSWPGFTSSSADLRIACSFMYGDTPPSEVEGAIFKIWGRSCHAIEWCSFMPKEREFLFLPGTKFRVRGWYAATQLNLRRGMRTEGESESFKLRCEH